MSRTLIVYLHGIGDNIMLTGVLKEYCCLHPEERIHLVVLNPGCAVIWKNNPLVNSVTVYPDHQPHFWNPVKFYLFHQWKVRRYIRELNRDGKYQKVLFPTIQTFPEMAYYITGTGRLKFYRLCSEMGVEPKPYHYELYTTPDATTDASKLLDNLDVKRLAVLHPFSGDTKRCLSHADIDEILRALQAKGLTTLVVGAPKEKKKLHPSCKTESAFGLSFEVLIEVLKHAEVFCGADSMVGHLAAFANIPKIIIYSNAWEPKNYRPISERGQVFLIPIKRARKSARIEEFHRVLETA